MKHTGEPSKKDLNGYPEVTSLEVFLRCCLLHVVQI